MIIDPVKCQGQAIELLSQDDVKDIRGSTKCGCIVEAGKPYRRSMVAWWTFDQSNGKTILDVSGNGLNGRPWVMRTLSGMWTGREKACASTERVIG